MDDKYIKNNAILRKWREVFPWDCGHRYYLNLTLPSQDTLVGCVFSVRHSTDLIRFNLRYEL
jgi:hypothetical protein